VRAIAALLAVAAAFATPGTAFGVEPDADVAPTQPAAEPPVPATATVAETPFERDTTPLPDAVVGTQDDGAEPAQADDEGSGAGGSIVRMIVGLGIVLLVIYGVYWLLKAYRKTKLQTSDGRIEILATTPLGPSRSVHLIRVGEEIVLVGSAEQGVTPLRVYTAQEAAQLGPLIDAAATVSRLAPEARRDGPRLAQVVDELRWRTVRR
jgi:flagellar biosynthetic protein FliO